MPRHGPLRLETTGDAIERGRSGRNALKNLRFAAINGNIPSLMGYTANVSGGDLVSTWVTKPLEHAEVPISS